jgi:hypothetical protein
MKDINWNAVAWEMGEEFLPGMVVKAGCTGSEVEATYQELVDWLNTRTEVVWETTGKFSGTTTKRLRGCEGTGNYDVKATFNHKTKGISYYFIESYKFEV